MTVDTFTLRAIKVEGYPFDIYFKSDGEKIGICFLPEFDVVLPNDVVSSKLNQLMMKIKSTVPGAQTIQYGYVAGRTTLYIKESDKNSIQSIINTILDSGYKVTPLDNSLITLTPGDQFDAFHSLSRLLEFIQNDFVVRDDGYSIFRATSLLPIQQASFWNELSKDPVLHQKALKISDDAYKVFGEENQNF